MRVIPSVGSAQSSAEALPQIETLALNEEEIEKADQEKENGNVVSGITRLASSQAVAKTEVRTGSVKLITLSNANPSVPYWSRPATLGRIPS